MLRVAVIEDHPVFRDGLRALLQSVGMEVVAEAPGLARLDEVLAADADVIVVDLGLPDGSGEVAIRAATVRSPRSRVLVLSMAGDPVSVSRAIASGAHGYLAKDSPSVEVVSAIRSLAAGSLVVGSTVAPKVRSLTAVPAYTLPEEQFPGLTSRERQVLGLIADGLSNAAIADALGISDKTVANYVSNVLSALHARDRDELRDLVDRAGRTGD